MRILRHLGAFSPKPRVSNWQRWALNLVCKVHALLPGLPAGDFPAKRGVCWPCCHQVCSLGCSLPSRRAGSLTSVLTFLAPTFMSEDNQTPPIPLKPIPHQDIAPDFRWYQAGQEEKPEARGCLWWRWLPSRGPEQGVLGRSRGASRVLEKHSPQVSRWRAEAGLTWWVGLGHGQGGRKQAQGWRWEARQADEEAWCWKDARGEPGRREAVRTRQSVTLGRIRIPGRLSGQRRRKIGTQFLQLK